MKRNAVRTVSKYIKNIHKNSILLVRTYQRGKRFTSWKKCIKKKLIKMKLHCLERNPNQAGQNALWEKRECHGLRSYRLSFLWLFCEYWPLSSDYSVLRQGEHTAHGQHAALESPHTTTRPTTLPASADADKQPQDAFFAEVQVRGEPNLKRLSSRFGSL